MMLVNLHHKPKREYTRITRPGPWGNPVVLGEKCNVCGKVHTRHGDGVSALLCYGRWLLNRLGDDQFARSLRKLEGHVLACYCTPAHCHGDLLRAYLDDYSERLALMGHFADRVPAQDIEHAHRCGRRAIERHLDFLRSRPEQTSMAL